VTSSERTSLTLFRRPKRSTPTSTHWSTHRPPTDTPLASTVSLPNRSTSSSSRYCSSTCRRHTSEFCAASRRGVCSPSTVCWSSLRPTRGASTAMDASPPIGVATSSQSDSPGGATRNLNTCTAWLFVKSSMRGKVDGVSFRGLRRPSMLCEYRRTGTSLEKIAMSTTWTRLVATHRCHLANNPILNSLSSCWLLTIGMIKCIVAVISFRLSIYFYSFPSRLQACIAW